MASSQSPPTSPSRPRTLSATSSPSNPRSTPAALHERSITSETGQMSPSGSASGRRTRGSSLVQSFLSSSPPYGMWQAAGEVASRAPTLGEIKQGAFSADGWTEEGQLERRGYTQQQIQKRRDSRASSQSSSNHRNDRTPTVSARRDDSETSSTLLKAISSRDANRPPSTIAEISAEAGTEAPPGDTPNGEIKKSSTVGLPLRSASVSDQVQSDQKATIGPDDTGTYPNGYRFPPKNSWSQSVAIGLKAFWKFFLTPFGFLVTIYGLNIVAWGAMLFFVLLEAAPAMCRPSCGDPNSARQIWVEIDSQILNALFCVTGFGLIPWRFRDFYYLIRWRVFGRYDYFRRLAGHNRSWFRLPGSDQLDVNLAPPPLYSKKNPRLENSPPEWPEDDIAKLEQNRAVPLPPTSMPSAPLTGVRAPPTKPFLIDVVVWMYVLNTVIQACLAGVMWGLTRFTRPPWVTGFLISLGCLVAIVAGVVIFVQAKKVKKLEGIPIEEEEVEVEVDDVEKAQDKDTKWKLAHVSKHTRAISTSDTNQQTSGSREQTPPESLEGNQEPHPGLTPGLRRTETVKVKRKGGRWFERR